MRALAIILMNNNRRACVRACGVCDAKTVAWLHGSEACLSIRCSYMTSAHVSHEPICILSREKKLLLANKDGTV